MATEALIEPYLERIREEIACTFANRDAGPLSSCKLEDLVLLNADYALEALLSIPSIQNSDLLYSLLSPYHDDGKVRSEPSGIVPKSPYPRNGTRDARMLSSAPHISARHAYTSVSGTGERLEEYLDNLTGLPEFWHLSPEVRSSQNLHRTALLDAVLQELRVQDYKQGRQSPVPCHFNLSARLKGTMAAPYDSSGKLRLFRDSGIESRGFLPFPSFGTIRRKSFARKTMLWDC